jgi:hypothetical protein
MTIKYSKGLAIAGVVVISALMVAPSYAEETAVATAYQAPAGVIHVVQKVINDNGGTAVSGDFTMTVQHHGTDVLGSPFVGVGSTITTFILEPGTYVLNQEPKAGYYGQWSSPGSYSGFVNLQAGQEITFTRTSDDVSGAFVVTTPAPVTENGATLPSTASPWFNALAAGMLLSAAGVIGVRKFAVQTK